MSARKGLSQHQMNYPVSQSYIYQTPFVHDSPAARTQSSSENLVSQTKIDRDLARSRKEKYVQRFLHSLAGPSTVANLATKNSTANHISLTNHNYKLLI